MSPSREISRRTFVQSASLASAGCFVPVFRIPGLGVPGFPANAAAPAPLDEFTYGDVTLSTDLHEKQLAESHALLMGLSEDSLLKPFRQMVGQPAPGEDLGGWYQYAPDSKDYFETGFAPGCTFGQWVSALARSYAIDRSPETREKVLRLNRLYAKTIGGDFYENTRFPAYSYDKLVCGLMDSHQYVGDPDAFAILQETTKTALPHLPKQAVEHGQRWRSNPDDSYTWDESYTISENLFLAYQRGAGEQYRALGLRFLDDAYYDPLAEGRSDLEGRHAYSHVNSLCSAMQAYLTLGSEKHLRAAKNGFDMIAAQSFATGGWGADETLRAPGSAEIYKSLTGSHSSFETPCGSYAHFKLTRYLLRVTRLPLRRQHGTRDVQHRAGIVAAESGWPDLLLFGLQLQSTQGVPRTTMGVLLRDLTPSGGRLSDQHVFPRWTGRVRESLHSVDPAVDAARSAGRANPEKRISLRAAGAA
jgi:hypothetical protein